MCGTGAELEKAGRHFVSLRPCLKGFDSWSSTKVYMIHFFPFCYFPSLEKQSHHHILWTPHIPQASEHSLNRQLFVSDTYSSEERIKPHWLLPLALLLHKTNSSFSLCAFCPRGWHKSLVAITSGSFVHALLMSCGVVWSLVGSKEKSAHSEMLLQPCARR